MGSQWRGDSHEWQGRLDQARTSQEVVAITKDFISLLSTAEISEVPEGAMPGLLDNPKHIEHYAVKLARAYVDHDDATVHGLHRISSYFTKAALRIMQLEGRISTELPEKSADGNTADTEYQGGISPSEEALSRQVN